MPYVQQLMILILEQPKSVRVKGKDFVGDRSVLILGSPCRRWSLPLVREEEDDGCGGGALNAPLLLALLLVQNLSETMRTRLICLESSFPS